MATIMERCCREESQVAKRRSYEPLPEIPLHVLGCCVLRHQKRTASISPGMFLSLSVVQDYGRGLDKSGKLGSHRIRSHDQSIFSACALGRCQQRPP